MYSLIETAKLNGVKPQRYLADVLTRIADHPAHHIAELLPWNRGPARRCLTQRPHRALTATVRLRGEVPPEPLRQVIELLR